MYMDCILLKGEQVASNTTNSIIDRLTATHLDTKNLARFERNCISQS